MCTHAPMSEREELVRCIRAIKEHDVADEQAVADPSTLREPRHGGAHGFGRQPREQLIHLGRRRSTLEEGWPVAVDILARRSIDVII